MKCMTVKHLRIILLILSAAVIVIPITIVGITDRGFGELVSHILVSVSILCLMAATLLGLDRNQKNRFFLKVGTAIGLAIVLLSVWL